IAARKAFTVAFGTAETAAACDYLGLVSGEKVPGKVAKSGFTVAKSAFVDAPVVNELPLALECELVSMDEETCRVVGRIVNCAVEESVLTDDKPDAAKMRPICYDPCAHVYRLMGEAVDEAFSAGQALSEGEGGGGGEGGTGTALPNSDRGRGASRKTQRGGRDLATKDTEGAKGEEKLTRRGGDAGGAKGEEEGWAPREGCAAIPWMMNGSQGSKGQARMQKTGWTERGISSKLAPSMR
ncbi:MAG: hypothetical protein J6Y19_10180, partial [Kiritimatiellae bacterium]|nr:hypothetical protein [Kiritimatiellia bacterium]